MITIDIESQKYPVGKYSAPTEFSKKIIDEWIQTIEDLPKKLRTEVQYMKDEQLDTPYREGGWTIRQVVHHLADSHMNAYIRFKMAMTEVVPTIKPYFEDRWAELEEAKHAPVEISLALLEALHRRWVSFVRTLSEEDLKRKFHHPESKKEYELRAILALYAWHSRHHLAHVSSLAERKGWKSKNNY